MTGAGGRDARSGAGYRPEIDGLRAIAVLAVILNHAGLPWLPGGLFGVDIFFVISGYLITGILRSDLAAGSFSIARFYERRVRRILPALMLTMLLCIPPMVLLALPDDLENFGQSLIATTLFANNVLLLLTSGYFEIETAFKPLMHTWSLGVEEQYYLLVPLLMLAAWRLGEARGVAIGVAAITALSLLCCLFLARHGPRADFFLILSRGWELGAGGLAVLAEARLRNGVDRRVGAVLALAGFALAMAPLIVSPWQEGPDLWTVLPVVGVCAFLVFARNGNPAARLLSLPPLVGIGLISYSAYLFHQPVFAFARLASLDPPSLGLMLALVVPVLACAWLSWRFVELPFRDRSRVSTRFLLTACATASLIVAAAGATFHLTSGFYRNWPQLADDDPVRPGASIAYNMGPERFRDLPLPELGDRVRVLVIGNSFGRDFINMGLETGNLDPRALSLLEVRDCDPLPDAGNIARADFIVLSSRYAVRDVPCIARRITALRAKTSVPIAVIGRKSFGSNNNAIMLLPRATRLSWRVSATTDALAANTAARTALPAAAFVDVQAMLSDAQGKVPVFTPDDKFISQDREHLTQAGARYVGPIVFRHPALAALVAASKR